MTTQIVPSTGVPKLTEKQEREAWFILSRAKIAMLEKHPFYAHVLTHLKFEFVEELRGGPSATDGKHVFIVPDLYLKLSKGEQISVLAHEQMHCLDGHLWRRGSRDPQWANVAQDIYIYHVLHSEGFEVLKENENCLTKILHTQAKRNTVGYTYDLSSFAGQFWEQIYDAIVPPSAQQPQGGGDDGEGDGTPQQGDGGGSAKQETPEMGKCGHCYKPAANPADAKEGREEWKEWIREAGMYAKMAGCKSGRWQELVEAATPTIPFEAHFYEFLKRGLGGDQSYEAFNRRFIHQGDYFPTEIMEQMGETILVNDTSGSRTNEDLAYAYGVFRAWRDQHRCIVHCVNADTECGEWHTYEEWDELPQKWNVDKRGGTSFEDPFKQVTERHLEPVALIYFTDGYNYGEFAPKPPYEVLWVLTGEYFKDFKPPYGTVVPVKSGKRED